MLFDATGDFLVPAILSRRRMLATCGVAALSASLATPSLAISADAAHDLRCDLSPAKFRRVKIVVESTGNLLVRPIVAAVKGKTVNQDQTAIRQVPFEVNVTQLYDERVLEQSENSIASLRFYRDLEGTLTIAKSANKPEIAQARRWICAKLDAEGRAYFSPVEPLEREEHDLVDVPGNPLALNRLSPGKSLKIGETWKHENTVLESILGIDKILEQTAVESKLLEVKDGVAIISLTGGIVGSVLSVKTQIQLQAKYNIDLKSHQVTWIAMGLTEKREVSAAQPGYESTTRIRLATMPIEMVAELDDANAERVKLDDPLAGKLLTFESSKGGFHFVHDARWHSMIDRPDGSVLRLVDRGDLVAQCTVTDLPKLSPGQRTSLDAFVNEIKAKLGKSLAAIGDTNESTTESGLTLQRVSATASADGVSVSWIYYLAIREDGRRVALMFTHDATMAERFAACDTTIVSSLQLVEKSAAPPAAVSAPAAAVSAPTKPAAKTSSRKGAVK